MKRFDNSQWADFVRGVAEGDLERAMREELASGSARAAREEKLWRGVAAVGLKDAEQQVPEYAVRVAKAASGLLRPGDVGSSSARGLRRLPFEVVFDSLTSVPAGVRGSTVAARHLVVESGDFTVDVRFESGPTAVGPAGRDAESCALSGQILRSEGESEPLPRTPILVFSGDAIVGSALTSAGGEFHTESLPSHPLSLCILIGSDKCIEVPLDPG